MARLSFSRHSLRTIFRDGSPPFKTHRSELYAVLDSSSWICAGCSACVALENKERIWSCFRCGGGYKSGADADLKQLKVLGKLYAALVP